MTMSTKLRLPTPFMFSEPMPGFLFGLMLCLFFPPAVVFAGPSAPLSTDTPRNLGAPVGEPRLVWETTSHNFGKTNAGDVVDINFAFSNPGTTSLEVTQVIPACDCTQAGAWDRRVAPGQHGHLALKLDTTGLSGVIERQVTVLTNSPQMPRTTLTLIGTVMTLLEATPPEMNFGRLGPGSPPCTRTLRLVNRNVGPVRLGSCSSSLTQFAPALNTVVPGREFILALTAPKNLPPGTYAGVLQLELFVPQRRNFKIPFNAWVPGGLELQPETLLVPSGPLPEDLVRTVVVRQPKPFTLTQVSTNAPGVQVNQVKIDEPGMSRRLIISFPRGWTSVPGENLWVELIFADPALGTHRIPLKTFSTITPTVTPTGNHE
ncbi:MAG: DUF1573 domain-containing protein [Candidatus Firestonebacteria bacterium]|nr:DUF1573 domain-containing protein [Candidatus Firestonebacteria bacterium]